MKVKALLSLFINTLSCDQKVREKYRPQFKKGILDLEKWNLSHNESLKRKEKLIFFLEKTFISRSLKNKQLLESGNPFKGTGHWTDKINRPLKRLRGVF